MKKKVLLPALFLTLALCFGLLPAPAFADVYNQDGWYIEDGVLEGYYGEETDLVIPNFVTSIKDYAFQNNKRITSVVIPNGVTSFPDNAFKGCTNLTSVTIPDTVQMIGNQAFSDCSSLTSIAIPEGVKTIPNNAFYGCTSLATISLPSTLTAINFNAFQGSGLISIDIPEGVTTIGEQAFMYCKNLATVSLPSTLIQIGNSAFFSCSELTSIDIPDKVYNLGDGVFMHCTSMTSVALSYANIPARTFYNCTSLTTITLREGVKTIGDSTFSDCNNVAVLILPSTITSIGEWAFTTLGDAYYAGSETDWNRVSFDKSMNYALAHATFHYNSTGQEPEYLSGSCGENLTWMLKDGTLTISGSGEMYDYDVHTAPWCGSISSITAVEIGNSVTSIGDWAFVECYELTSVTIPNGVTSIGEHAFADCRGLTDLSIGNNVTDIGLCAFVRCSNLANVTIPDSVTSIGFSAFYGCGSLTSVTIPDSVTNIVGSAFGGCSSLTSINVASGNPAYTSVDGILFCKDKTVLHTYPAGKSSSYSIPNSVTSIEVGAFSGCSELMSVTIPSSVTSIGNNAFHGCTSLGDVYYGGTEKEWKAINIDYDNDHLTSANIHYITPFSVSLGDSATTVQVVDERGTLKNCTTVYAARYENGRMVELVAGTLSGNRITFSKPLTEDYVLFFLNGGNAPVREKAALSTAS